MKFFEVEQKYHLKRPGSIRKVLKSIGAKKISAGTEYNEFFDKTRFLAKQKMALRLRRFGGKATLTLKGSRLKAKFTKRMEIEMPIDPAIAKALLRYLGCREIMRYSKRREMYKTPTALIALDFLSKFGWFLEIEASSQEIARLARQLGLRQADREERSYLQMLFGWKH